MKRAPLFALLAANGISLVGNMFALIAIPWFVLETTGSPARTGVTGAFTTLASVAAAFFGGAIVDRLGFKRTSILADLASGVTVALIPLLYATLGLEFWQLLVLVFAGALLDAPGTTAREALMPELARLAGWSLEAAGSAIQVVDRAARMLGAPLAGLLIAWVGTQNVLWLDAASFAISAGVTALVVPAALGAARAAGGEEGGYLAELAGGIRFLLADRMMLAVLLLVVMLNFLDAPLFGVAYPVYVRQFYGPALDLGLMLAAGGAGSMISALLFGWKGRRFSRRGLFFGGFLLTTLRFWIYPLTPAFGWVVAAAFVAGLGAGPINPVLYAIQFERIPAHLRGRVLGAITALAFTAAPLGMLVGGVLLERLDVRFVIGLIGAVYLASILLLAAHPVSRSMDERQG